MKTREEEQVDLVRRQVVVRGSLEEKTEIKSCFHGWGPPSLTASSFRAQGAGETMSGGHGGGSSSDSSEDEGRRKEKGGREVERERRREKSRRKRRERSSSSSSSEDLSSESDGSSSDDDGRERRLRQRKGHSRKRKKDLSSDGSSSSSSGSDRGRRSLSSKRRRSRSRDGGRREKRRKGGAGGGRSRSKEKRREKRSDKRRKKKRAEATALAGAKGPQVEAPEGGGGGTGEGDLRKAPSSKQAAQMEEQEVLKAAIRRNAEIARERLLNGDIQKAREEQNAMQNLFGSVDWRARKKLKSEKRKLERSIQAGNNLAVLEEREEARMDAFRIALGLPTTEAQRQAEWREAMSRQPVENVNVNFDNETNGGSSKKKVGPRLPR
eukprot:TRINITY_DN2253_c4_g1_i1.p1 TRINITY_DN2253_c4_g1~~TRINITY_DN2253_c4_g1_i1.p1  ORF type:complete len:381 (+),score=109.76 TRINITY_DN2253_c4_g1_i1:38-1180(+)